MNKISTQRGAQPSYIKMSGKVWIPYMLLLIFASHPLAGTYVIGGTDEIQMILDDQIVKIQSMHASPFVKPFKHRVIEWEAILQTLQVSMHAIMTVVKLMPLRATALR